MTLQTLNEKIGRLHDEAAAVQRSYTNRRREIESDPELSEEGRRRATDDLFGALKAKISGLRSQEEDLIKTEITTRELRIDGGRAYGTSDVVAFRDAQERADRITDPTDAQRILERAVRQGDDSLAHAVFRRALDAGWSTVLKAFTDAKPELTETLADLRELRAAQQQTFQRTLTYGLIR